MKAFNLYWVRVKASEIKKGNFISGFYSKTPRYITDIKENNGIILLYESDYQGHQSLYRSCEKDDLFDLLMDADTKKPFVNEVE